MPLSIRRARPSDAADLTDLIYASKRSNGYGDTFMAACAEELRVTPDLLQTQNIWVTEDEKLLGCVALEVDGTEGEITKFFVHPDAKRRGVGRQLWQTALTEARNAGLTRLVLDADPEAVAFYQAMGFRTIGQSPSGSIPGRFLPLMAMDL